MHWKVLAPLHFVTYACGCGAKLPCIPGCVHGPCDACAKGELVHAEATSTSDLVVVFGISNFAAIELYQSYGCA